MYRHYTYFRPIVSRYLLIPTYVSTYLRPNFPFVCYKTLTSCIGNTGPPTSSQFFAPIFLSEFEEGRSHSLSKTTFLFCLSGPYRVPIHHERRVRAVARLDRPGAPGRRRLPGAGRGARRHRGRRAARPDRALQPAAAGLRGQAARLPRARRGAARALAGAPALPPAPAARAARAAPARRARRAPRAHQAALPGRAHLLSNSSKCM